jgi:gas vesicle protein
MNVKNESGFPYLLLGLGLGAVGGFLSALLAFRESREYLRSEAAKGVEYLSTSGKKLRERAEGMAQKGRELISQRCCQCGSPVDPSTVNGKEEKIAEP